MDDMVRDSLIIIAIFAILMIICLIGWLTCYISAKTLLLYMEARKYDMPSRKEIRKWTKQAARHTLGLQTETLE